VRDVLLGLLDAGKGVNLGQVVGVKLDWCFSQSFLFPLVWRQVGAGFGNSLEGGLSEVTEGGGATFGTGVDIGVSSVSKNFLWDWGGNDTGTSWSWDESHVDGTTFGVDLAWDGVWFTKFGTPVTSSNWNNRQLSQNDSCSDGVGNFFGALDSESDVSVVVTNNDGGLESGSLTGSGLFLDWLDLEDFVFQSRAKEVFDNFGFFNRKGEGVNFAQGENLTIFNQSSKFRDRHPYFLVVAPAMVFWLLISHCLEREFSTF